MHAVHFWGQRRGLPGGRECPTCDWKRKEARVEKSIGPRMKYGHENLNSFCPYKNRRCSIFNLSSLSLCTCLSHKFVFERLFYNTSLYMTVCLSGTLQYRFFVYSRLTYRSLAVGDQHIMERWVLIVKDNILFCKGLSNKKA